MEKKSDCGVEDCNKLHHAKGLCSYHYYKWRRTGDNDDVVIHYRGTGIKSICDVDGCNRPSVANKVCVYHYQKYRLYGDYNYKSNGLRKERSQKIIIDKNTIIVGVNENGYGDLKRKIKGDFVKHTDRGLFKDEDGNYWIKMMGGRFKKIDLRTKYKKSTIF